MRRFGLFGFVVLLLLVGAVGLVAYNLGVSAGATDAAIAEGAAVIYAPGAGISPFGLIVGFFFVVLILGFIAKAFAGPRMIGGPGPWGHRGRGWRADWSHEDVPEQFRPMLERWHRSAHDPAPDSGPTQAAPPRPAGPPLAPGTGSPPAR